MNSNFLYLQPSNHNLEGARRIGIFLCDVTVYELRFDLENIDRKLWTSVQIKETRVKKGIVGQYFLNNLYLLRITQFRF